MKFINLINFLEWDDVRAAIRCKSPGLIEKCVGHLEHVYTTLCNMEPVQTDMRIIIYETDEFGNRVDRPASPEEEEMTVRAIAGKNGTLNNEFESFKYLAKSKDLDYAYSETEFDLYLTPWEIWLGMDIDEETLKAYPVSQIVTDCLEVMSFESHILEELEEIRQYIREELEEYRKLTVEERTRKFSNWTKRFADLEKKYLPETNGNPPKSTE